LVGLEARPRVSPFGKKRSRRYRPEGIHGELALAPDLEGRPAGCQNPDRRRATDDLGNRRRCTEDVLERVQDEQKVLVANTRGDRGCRLLIGVAHL